MGRLSHERAGPFATDGTLSGLPNSPAITDNDRVREQTWPAMTDIGNWAKFYTKDTNLSLIHISEPTRPY